MPLTLSHTQIEHEQGESLTSAETMHALRAPGGRDERTDERGMACDAGIATVLFIFPPKDKRFGGALTTRRVVDATASDSERAVREAWLMSRDR